LLADGRVLIISDGSAEVYDPSTGSFSPTGPPLTDRWAHTATLLPNGKVLVAGGCCGQGPVAALSSTEIYNPASGTFEPGPWLNFNRYGHAAIPLPDGSVWIAGGDNGADGPLSNTLQLSAEIYDPTIGIFDFCCLMSSSHFDPAAFPLSDGRPFVAGGGSYFFGLDTNVAHVFDPFEWEFSAGSSMTVSRYETSGAPLLDGRALMVGGRNGPNGFSSSAELFDPETERFSPTGSMSIDRYGHSSNTLGSGKILVSGGISGTVGTLNSSELYDHVTGEFSSTGPMSMARTNHEATVLSDGQVLVTGGLADEGDSTGLSSAELYDPGVRLRVSKMGVGEGTVSSVPAGINCRAECSSLFSTGDEVELSATPSFGSTFSGWSGDCSGRRSCLLTMDELRSVKASFSKPGSFGNSERRCKEAKKSLRDAGRARFRAQLKLARARGAKPRARAKKKLKRARKAARRAEVRMRKSCR
jgi:hypothetical protein